MSKQLAISSAFSIFAMVAFVLFAAPAQTGTGANAEASAPVHWQASVDLPFIAD
ncbi:hypothetical protein [Alteraurantiacibacter aquimixticola]|uniref:hypothetical protein n=1 Tax=Alteraurantiacibacter aquimixticola TaxID=2489173 RepID=UPI00145B20FF|nr:hypothetical protein [Alteraurantiacibacter aquimixticola]